MDIKSDNKIKNVFAGMFRDNGNNPYIIMALIIIAGGTIFNFIGFDWGVSIFILIIIGVILTGFLNMSLVYNVFSWSKYLLLVALFIGVTSPSHLLQIAHDYKHEERIDETLTVEKGIEVFWNDENKVFILFEDGVKQPVVIDVGGSSETYNKLKAGYLDNKLKIERRKVKRWHWDESFTGYYLDGHRFD